MRKLRCDSAWIKLSQTQRATLETWLFDDRIGYDQTLARVETEFGLQASRSSLCQYYRRRLHERQALDLVEAQAMADTVAAPASNTAAMRDAALKLMAKTALKIAFESPDRLQDLESLTRILLLSEDIETRRARVQLEQKQFDYKTIAAASKELPNLARLLMKIDEDDTLSSEKKLEKVHDLLYPARAEAGLHQFPEQKEEVDPEPEPEEAVAEAEKKEDEEEIPKPESHPAKETPPPPAPPPVKTEPPETPEARELRQLTESARQGNAHSAHCLGARYRDGLGVEQDWDKARQWLTKAAGLGLGAAKIELIALNRHFTP